MAAAPSTFDNRKMVGPGGATRKRCNSIRPRNGRDTARRPGTVPLPLFLHKTLGTSGGPTVFRLQVLATVSYCSSSLATRPHPARQRAQGRSGLDDCTASRCSGQAHAAHVAHVLGAQASRLPVAEGNRQTPMSFSCVVGDRKRLTGRLLGTDCQPAVVDLDRNLLPEVEASLP